jgi:hypothetical protein
VPHEAPEPRSRYPALKDEAATLYAFIGQAAARDYQTDAVDDVLVNGEIAGPTLWNEQQCRSILSHRYGASMDRRDHQGRGEELGHAPDDVKRWLDADMDGSAIVRTWSSAWPCGPTLR